MSGGDTSIRIDRVIGVVHPNPVRDRHVGLVLVGRFVVDPAAPTREELAALDEMLMMLGLKPTPAPLPEPGGPVPRTRWAAGAYDWRLLPSGTYLHAVRTDGGRRAASCGALPAEGWEWRTADAELLDSAPKCARCEKYLAPGGGRLVV